MSITTVGDRLIHYETLGRGEPLIFLHGWLGSWRYWWPSMQALSTHYRTVALDLWGFGDSSKASDSYSLDDYVEMLEQFVDRLGIVRPVLLVGHGLGAAVALRYAVARPQAVKRLAAVALPVPACAPNQRLLDGDAAAVLARVLKVSYPEVDTELRKIDPLAFSLVADEVYRADFSDDLREPPVPTLLVYGNADTMVHYPNGHLAGPTHNRVVVTLEGSHFPMLEDAPRFNRLILDFLRSESDLSDVSPKEFWQRRVN
jgi:pimeloyl-ACP methyl ester carboxylesterase